MAVRGDLDRQCRVLKDCLAVHKCAGCIRLSGSGGRLRLAVQELKTAVAVRDA